MFALLPAIWRWNVGILSESVSLSMMALVDREATRLFAAAGMALSPALLEGAGRARLSTQGVLRSASPEFFAWSAEQAAPLYWRWVLSQPSSYVRAWRAADEYYAADLEAYPDKLRLPFIVTAARSSARLGGGSWSLLLVVIALGAAALKPHARRTRAATLRVLHRGSRAGPRALAALRAAAQRARRERGLARLDSDRAAFDQIDEGLERFEPRHAAHVEHVLDGRNPVDTR